jgi:hypothetical protein
MATSSPADTAMAQIAAALDALPDSEQSRSLRAGIIALVASGTFFTTGVPGWKFDNENTIDTLLQMAQLVEAGEVRNALLAQVRLRSTVRNSYMAPAKGWDEERALDNSMRVFHRQYTPES